MWQKVTEFRAPATALIIAYAVSSLCCALAAPSPASAAPPSERKSCLYAAELQDSVPARKRFLTALRDLATGNARGGTLSGEVSPADAASEGGAVDALYARIAPTSYTEEEGGYPWQKRDTPRETQVTGLDPFSVHCLGCHDGMSASDVAVDLRNSPWNRRSRVRSFAMDHPVGMDYERYAAAGTAFRRVAAQSGMVFVDGRVGCLTCHNPLNPERGHLVMSDRRSALCRSCHDN